MKAPRLVDARRISLSPSDATDAGAIARALPDPDSLPGGALVVLMPTLAEAPSLTSRLLAAIGRGRAVSRVHRCTAMVARGYVRVGAGVDPDTRADLVWGYATGSGEPGEPVVTEPA